MPDSKNCRPGDEELLTTLLQDRRQFDSPTEWWPEFIAAVRSEPAVKSYLYKYGGTEAFDILVRDALGVFAEAVRHGEPCTRKQFLKHLAPIGLDSNWWREWAALPADGRDEERFVADSPWEPDILPYAPEAVGSLLHLFDESSTPLLKAFVERVVASLGGAEPAGLTFDALGARIGLDERGSRDGAAGELLIEVLTAAVSPGVPPAIRDALIAAGADCAVRNLTEPKSREVAAAPFHQQSLVDEAIELSCVAFLLTVSRRLGKPDQDRDLDLPQRRLLNDWLLISQLLNVTPLVLAAQVDGIVSDPSTCPDNGLAALLGLGVSAAESERAALTEVIARCL